MSKIKIEEYEITNNKENNEDDPNFKTIKKLMNNKNINLNNNMHLKYMLSLTLKEEQKDIDFHYLINFLLNYKKPENEFIFYEYYFQCCELGKLNYITLLLNNQLSVNSQNDIGETALHIAIAKKDINLIKLLIEYKPNLSLTTYKDKLNCYNYADTSNNEEIKNLIYSKITSSKEIKSKLKSFINNTETKDTINSVESGNKNDILNYCGEAYKSGNKIDDSELKTSEEEPIKINEIIKKNKKSESMFNGKEFFDKNVYVKKKNNSAKGTSSIEPKDLIFNRRENGSTNIKLNNTIYQKKKINLLKSENPGYKYLTEKKNKKTTSYTKNIQDINIKRNHKSKDDYSLDLFDKDKDSNNNNITIIDKNKYNEVNSKENKINTNKIYNIKDSQNLLELFFTEINLPKEYAYKFIENGFDDLNLLIFQTKSSIALSNQNLKDINIESCGERAKILIHLEEKAGLIPYFLEKDKIYVTEKECKEKNINSLFKFLTSMNLEQYENNFKENGYFTAELLFTQMNTRHPLKEDDLKNEFKIEKRGHKLLLYNNLVNGSKEYIKKLRSKGHSNMVYDGASLNSCEPCSIY